MPIRDPETGEEYQLRYDDEVHAALTEVQKEFACEHRETDVRRAINAGGAITYRKQCLRCGAFIGSAISHKEIGMNVLDANISKKNEWEQNFKSKYDSTLLYWARKQSSHDSDFWRRYNIYLQSESWKQKRLKVLKRANFVCEGCLHRKATQVHHLTYTHCFDEFLWELVAVCDECHNKIHPDPEGEGAGYTELEFE
jgi:hypothetical protein